MDYKRYEGDLIVGITAVLLGLGAKNLLRHEMFGMGNSRKIVETFLVVVVASVAGRELTEKLKKDGYL